MKNKIAIALMAIAALAPPNLRADEMPASPANVNVFQTTPVAPSPTSIGDVLTNLPQTYSFSNATIEIDSGLLGLGIGQQTTTALAFLRGSYNWNLHFYTGAELQLGAGNTIDGLVVYPLGVRKVLGDNYEFYGAIGGEDNLVARTGEAVIELGAKWNVFASLGATNSVWANAAVGAEARSQILFNSPAGTPQSLSFVGFVNWKF